jgi:serine/threonine protein phosphatase 1
MRFFRRPRPHPPSAALPQGLVVYAIGDVHGRLDLLQALVAQIAADVAALPPESAIELVFLGDYIDRGPASFGVVEEVLDLSASAAFTVRTLKGNHEDALLSFLEDARVGPTWARYGAIETLRSYGVRAPVMLDDPQGWEAAREALDEAIPERHKAFLRALELYVIHGDYCFVHAGLRPGVPIADQEEFDLLTIRAEFLFSKRPFEKKVVYGHTPGFVPKIEPHRIGIDTGAFATGVLTCLRLSGTESHILQARL